MHHKKSLLTLLVVSLLAFICLGFIGFHYAKQSVIAAKKQDAETMLAIASQQSSNYIEQYQHGFLTKPEAEEKIIQFLSALQFESAYIWANDSFGIARVHARKEIIGQFQQSYVKNMAALANQQFHTLAQTNIKPVLDKRILKVNVISKIPEWDWVIGYGFYMDDVNAIAINAQQPLLLSLLLLMLIVSFTAMYCIKRTHDV